MQIVSAETTTISEFKPRDVEHLASWRNFQSKAQADKTTQIQA